MVPPPTRPQPAVHAPVGVPGRPGYPGGPGYPGAPRPIPGYTPSGLFPAKPMPGAPGPNGLPQRPVFRELLPITAGKAAIGVLAGTLWMGLFGLLATSASGYVWWSIIAAVLAWPVLAVLARFGDRGVAAGAAVSTGFGLSIAGLVVAAQIFSGGW
jgi:hypothetical protein